MSIAPEDKFILRWTKSVILALKALSQCKARIYVILVHSHLNSIIIKIKNAKAAHQIPAITITLICVRSIAQNLRFITILLWNVFALKTLHILISNKTDVWIVSRGNTGIIKIVHVKTVLPINSSILHCKNVKTAQLDTNTITRLISVKKLIANSQNILIKLTTNVNSVISMAI